MNKETKLSIIIEARNKTEQALGQVRDNLQGVKNANENILASMKTVGKVGAVVFAGLSAATMGFVKSAANFEQQQVAFETMLGSGEKATKLLDDLSKFASRTPFEIDGIRQNAKQLLGMGIEADKIIPTLKALGDVSAGLSVPLDRIALNFGQIKAQGKLTGRELRDFAVNGVPLLDELAKMFGKTKEEISAMVSAGEIGFDDVEQAFISMSSEGGKFANLMGAQSETLAGMWSNLKDQITLTSQTIGMQLLPYLKPLIEKLSAIIEKIKDWVERNPELASKIVVVGLAVSGLMAVLLPLSFILPTLIMAVKGLGLAFSALRLLASPMGLVFVGLIFAIIQIIRIIHMLKNDWDLIWLGIQLTVAGVVNGVVNMFEKMVNFIIDGINFVIEKINTLLDKLAGLPKIGKQFEGLKIDLLERKEFSGINEDALVQNFLNKQSPEINQVVVTGNTVLSNDVAVEIGDKIMEQLKLSTPI